MLPLLALSLNKALYQAEADKDKERFKEEMSVYEVKIKPRGFAMLSFPPLSSHNL
jgi:hypothetical protein